ncbi:MAG: 3-oxoacyl-ACP synthase III [Lentisphaerae bacterium GWF2_45_14]|nr:MAG: 3-oxoacyl-ACP synthase III [Lentisphaerae bacterium GWF2_45_14]
MRYKNVNIEAFGYELPPETISSSEIESMMAPAYERLGLREGRLELMTGIKERRLWAPGTTPGKAASMAGGRALESSGIAPEEIGCLIMCSVSRDFLEPATATVVHDNLKLSPNCMVFDISNACLGILTGMITAANMIELGHINAALLVAGENSRPLLEATVRAVNEDNSLTRQSIKRYFASFTIGSGAIGVVLSNKNLSRSGMRLTGGVSFAATQYNYLCRGNSDKGMNDGSDIIMNTDSETLMVKGVETAACAWKLFLEELNVENSTFDCICTHQVGSAHKRLLFETLELDISKDYATLELMGNTGSVSCPFTAAKAIESSFAPKGGKMALLGIGSGINCTMLGVDL